MHLVLVNRLRGLRLPSDSLSRLSDRHYMTEILLLSSKTKIHQLL